MADNWNPLTPQSYSFEEVVSAAKLNQEIRDRMQALFNGLVGDASADSDVVQRGKSGTLAARPSPGKAGRTYYATDTKTLSIDNGTTWDTPVKVVRKTADEELTSDTTLQNDNELLFAVAANEKWAFELYLLTAGHDNGDIKVDFTGPTAFTSLRWSGLGYSAAGAGGATLSLSSIQDPPDSIAFALSAPGTDWPVHLKGVLLNGANAGNLTLRWAQNTSYETATKVLAGSWLKAHIVA